MRLCAEPTTQKIASLLRPRFQYENCTLGSQTQRAEVLQQAKRVKFCTSQEHSVLTNHALPRDLNSSRGILPRFSGQTHGMQQGLPSVSILRRYWSKITAACNCHFSTLSDQFRTDLLTTPAPRCDSIFCRKLSCKGFPHKWFATASREFERSHAQLVAMNRPPCICGLRQASVCIRVLCIPLYIHNYV